MSLLFFLLFFFLNTTVGAFRAAVRVPSRRVVERCELAWPVCVRRRWDRPRAPAPPRREMDRPARVCARVFVGVSAGLSGRCMRGDVRNPGETSASHRLGEPVRVF